MLSYYREITKCPRCRTPMAIGKDLEVGDKVYCIVCGAPLRVVPVTKPGTLGGQAVSNG